jgi:ribosome biogenesis protein Nip4
MKNNVVSPTQTLEKNLPVPTLNLEIKQNEKDDDSSDGSKGSTIKLSRFSSKLKMEIPNEQQKLFFMRNFITEMINKIVDEYESKQISEQPTSSDDDDYFKQIEQRRKKMDESANPKIASIINNTISQSKFANKFTETTKIRIYLLNTQNFTDISVGINDTIKHLKTKVFNYLEKEGKVKLKYKIIEAYELRMVEDDDDDILPNMEFPAFDDKLNVIKARNDYLAFVEKINFNPETDMSYITSNNILGTTVKDSETVS